MIKRLLKYILKNPNDKWYWLFFITILKSVDYFLIIQNSIHLNPKFIGAFAGDAFSYITPIDNLINSGSYFPDYRMPGYGFFYYIFHLFFNSNISLDLLIVLQITLSILSVYVLAITVFNFTNSKKIFYIVIFLFGISTYTSLWDFYIATESFTTSFSIFFVYYLYKYQSSNKPDFLFISGIFYTFICFMRPVYLLYCIIPIIIILRLYFNKKSLLVCVKHLLIFLSFFILIDSLWIIRNYKAHQKFYPLTVSAGIYADEFENSVEGAAMRVIQGWGLNYVWWDISAEIRWFNIGDSSKGPVGYENSKIKLPDYIYTSEYNIDTLKRLSNNLYKYYHSQSPSLYYNSIINNFQKIESSFRTEKPFRYYFVSRLLLFKTMYFRHQMFHLFSKPFRQLSFILKMIILFYITYYFFIILFSLIGIIIFLKKNILKNPLYIFIYITLYSFIIFPLVLKLCTFRYFAPAYPFALVLAIYTLIYFIDKIKNKYIVHNSIS